MVFKNGAISMTNQIFHTVYQITNLINGKIYIGVHKMKDPYDEIISDQVNLLNVLY